MALVREQIKKRDGAICRYCGEHAPDGHVDHVVPLSQGGTDGPDNLAWTCPACNLAKGAREPGEWAEGTKLPPPIIVERPQADSGEVVDW